MKPLISVPKAPTFKPPPVPTNLPKITAPTSAEIAKVADPSPTAQALLKPGQTPPEYLGALQEEQLGTDMVKTMAHGMPDREGVQWAAESAGKVSDKLPPQEVRAMNAAQTWAANPTPENQINAAAAASECGCRGPGSMAAQGAAWAKTDAASAPSAAAAAAPRLAPYPVTGAVLMASAIAANPAVAVPTMVAPALTAPTFEAPALAAPQAPSAPEPPAVVPPNVQEETFRQQYPFIALGLDIASGKPVV